MFSIFSMLLIIKFMVIILFNKVESCHYTNCRFKHWFTTNSDVQPHPVSINNLFVYDKTTQNIIHVPSYAVYSCILLENQSDCELASRGMLSHGPCKKGSHLKLAADTREVMCQHDVSIDTTSYLSYVCCSAL